METKEKAGYDAGSVYQPSRSRILLYAIRIIASITALGLYVTVFRDYDPPVWLFILLGVILVPFTAYMVWHDVIAMQMRVILTPEHLEYHSGSSVVLVPYNDLEMFARQRLFDDAGTVRKNSERSSPPSDGVLYSDTESYAHRHRSSGCWYIPWGSSDGCGGGDGCGDSDGCGGGDLGKNLGPALLLIGAFMLAIAALLFLWNIRPSNWGILLRYPASRKGGGWLDRLLQSATIDFVPIGAVVEIPRSGDLVLLDTFRRTTFGEELAGYAPHLFEAYYTASTYEEKAKPARKAHDITPYSGEEGELVLQHNGIEYTYRGRKMFAPRNSLLRLENQVIGDEVCYGIVLNAPPMMMRGAPLPEYERLFLNLSAYNLAPTLEDLRDTEFGAELAGYAPHLFR